MVESKYLEFQEHTPEGRKTKIWYVISKTQGTLLAEIKWHGSWRQYTLWPSPNTIWNNQCLVDIVTFLCQENNIRREGKSKLTADKEGIKQNGKVIISKIEKANMI